MLLLTNTPANKTHRQSPARKYPLRGCSTTTIDRVLGNADACSRLLAEFDNLEDVGTLRKCNKQLLRIIDNHSHLWRTVQYSPPGLARLSAHGLHTEKVLRKGAMQGNREAQIMLALMYYHGYTCPCHPLDLPANAISCPQAM